MCYLILHTLVCWRVYTLCTSAHTTKADTFLSWLPWLSLWASHFWPWTYQTARCLCETETPVRRAGLNGEEKGTLCFANFLLPVFLEQVAKFLKEEVRPALIPYQSKMGGKIELAL